MTAVTKLRHFLLGRKAMTNLDSVLKSGDITLPKKSPYSQSYGFSYSHVQTWELDHTEGWMFKNWWLQTVCWRRLLRVPWTSGRSNQSILKEINPEYSLERLMLKLKLQYFGHMVWRANSLEKTLSWERLKAGGEGSVRGWNGWTPTQWTWVWANSGR